MGFFTDIMTVYNYKRTDSGEIWIRSVIHGVQWRHQKVQLDERGRVLHEKPVESITIDFEKKYNNPTYISSKQYTKATDVAEFYTLDPSGKDIVVLGEYEVEITDDYTLSDLRDDYDCFTVTQVKDNTNRPRLRTIKVIAE